MAFPNFSLEGKVALVTGVGKRGMGRAMALTFAQAGADVAVSDILDSEEIAQEIRDIGKRSLAIKADIGRKADVDNMIDRVVKELGTIDILVNAASMIVRKYLMDTSDEEWDWTMNVNLRGFYLCCKAAARVMIEKTRTKPALEKGSLVY